MSPLIVTSVFTSIRHSTLERARVYSSMVLTMLRALAIVHMREGLYMWTVLDEGYARLP